MLITKWQGYIICDRQTDEYVKSTRYSWVFSDKNPYIFSSLGSVKSSITNNIKLHHIKRYSDSFNNGIFKDDKNYYYDPLNYKYRHCEVWRIDDMVYQFTVLDYINEKCVKDGQKLEKINKLWV